MRPALPSRSSDPALLSDRRPCHRAHPRHLPGAGDAGICPGNYRGDSLVAGHQRDDGLPAPFFGNSSYPFVVIVVAAFTRQSATDPLDDRQGVAGWSGRTNKRQPPGVNGAFVRVLAFAISGDVRRSKRVLLAGALGYITPDNFNVSLTLLLLTMIVVGGLGPHGGRHWMRSYHRVTCATRRRPVISGHPFRLDPVRGHRNPSRGLIAFPQRSRHLRSVLTWIMSKMHRHPVGHQDGCSARDSRRQSSPSNRCTFLLAGCRR